MTGGKLTLRFELLLEVPVSATDAKEEHPNAHIARTERDLTAEHRRWDPPYASVD